jgi:UDP-glucose 4-epimerase
MNVCVTGGLGFIGSALCAELRRMGHPARIIDSAVAHEQIDGVAVTRGDIRDLDTLERGFAGIDVVIHLAAKHSVLLCEREPGLAREVNVTGTRNVADAAARQGVRRIVFASSAAVYSASSGSQVTPHRIEKRRAAGVYARSKLAGERVLREQSATSGIEVSILRPFNAYGPGQSMQPEPLPAVAAAVRALRSGVPFSVRGAGDQVRDFIHVADVAHLLAAEAESDVPVADALDVGTGVGTSVLDLLDQLGRIAGHDIPRVHVAAHESDAPFSVASIRHAEARHPDFRPRTLSAGLADTLSRESRRTPDAMLSEV